MKRVILAKTFYQSHKITQRTYHLVCVTILLLITIPTLPVYAEIAKPGTPETQPLAPDPNPAQVAQQDTYNQTNRPQVNEFSGIRFQEVSAASGTSWEPNLSLPTARTDMQVAIGPSGNIFTFGGRDQNGRVTNVVEAYHVREGKWHCSIGNPAPTCAIHDLASMPTPRAAMAGAIWVSNENYLFLAGGMNAANQVVDTVEVYSFQENRWYCSVGDLSCPASLRIVAPLGTARAFAVGVTGPDGAPYVFGGMTGSNTVTGAVETWNPATRVWEQLPSLPTPRAALGAVTEMRTESIFLIGGIADNQTFTPVDTVEVYHLPSSTWTCSQNRAGCQHGNRPRLPTPRSDMAVAAGFDGRLYAIGGAQRQVIKNTVEIYDPGTETWSTGTSLPTARAAASAAASPVNGQLYVIGGQHSIQFSSIVDTVETFTPPPPQDPEQSDVRDRAYPSTYLPVSQLLLTRAEEYEGYPTNTIFGNYTRQDTDLSMPGYGPEIRITRTYNSAYPIWGPFGWGWNATYEMYAIDVGSAVVVIHHDGRQDSYRKENGQLIAPTGSVDRLVGNGGTYTLTTRDRLVYRFNASRLTSVQDPDGNTVTLEYSGGRWTAIQDASGRRWTLSYNVQGLVSQIKNPAGQMVRYTYNARDELITVTDPAGNVMRYEYDGEEYRQLLAVYDANNNLVVANAYLGTVDEETNTYYGRIDRQADSRSQNFTDDIHRFLYAGGVTAYVDPTGAISGSVYDDNYQLRYKIDSLGDVSAFGYPDRAALASESSQSGQSLLVSQEVDGNGGTTAFTYDDRGNLLAITDPVGNETHMAYDERDNLILEIDPLGNQTTWRYDDQDHLLSMTDAAGNIATYTYDSNGQRTSMTDALGNTTRYEYDSHGYQTAVIDALGHTTRFTYYSTGQAKTETDPLGRTTSYTYDARNLPLTVTAPDGGITRYTYDAAGNRLTVTDPRGNVARSTYSKANDLIAEMDALGNTTRYEYDAMGRETKRTLPDGGVWTTSYDDNGRKQWEASPLCNQNPACASDPVFYCLELSEECPLTFFGYDANGNLLYTFNAFLQLTDYTYDANNRLTEVDDALGNVTKYAYDAAGNRIRMTDANGNQTTYRYDRLQRLVGVTNPLGHTQTTVYDALGRVTSTTNGANETNKRTYDAVGQLLAISANDINIQFTYDAAGNRRTMTDGHGTTTYGYDTMDRLISIGGPYGNIDYGYDLAGNRTTLRQPGATISYSYDTRNQLSEVQLEGETIVSYSYDNLGRTQSQQAANGVYTKRTYDLAGRLTGLTTNGPESELQRINYTMDLLGNRIAENSTNFNATYSYDKLNQLTGASIDFTISNPATTTPSPTPTPTATSVSPNQPTPTSTVTSMSPPANATATPTRSPHNISLPVVIGGVRNAVTSNQLDRSAEVQHDAQINRTTINQHKTYEYSYDAVGNRTKLVENGVTITYRYDSANHMTSAGNRTVVYDTAGRLTNDGVNQYTYDPLDRLTTISGSSTANFAYNGDNHRVRETVRNTTNTYLIDPAAPLPVRIAATTNGATERYLYGNEQVLQISPDGALRYIHVDGLGNVRMRTTASGAVLDTSAYAPTGERLAGQGSFGFTGEPYVADGLLVHLRARDYSPTLGRFLTMDPFPPEEVEPRMFHMYMYGLNNPVNVTDPTGKCIGYPCGAPTFSTLMSGIAFPTANTSFGFQRPQFVSQFPSFGGGFSGNLGLIVPPTNPLVNNLQGLQSLPQAHSIFDIGEGFNGGSNQFGAGLLHIAAVANSGISPGHRPFFNTMDSVQNGNNGLLTAALGFNHQLDIRADVQSHYYNVDIPYLTWGSPHQFHNFQ